MAIRLSKEGDRTRAKPCPFLQQVIYLTGVPLLNPVRTLVYPANHQEVLTLVDAAEGAVQRLWKPCRNALELPLDEGVHPDNSIDNRCAFGHSHLEADLLIFPYVPNAVVGVFKEGFDFLRRHRWPSTENILKVSEPPEEQVLEHLWRESRRP